MSTGLLPLCSIELCTQVYSTVQGLDVRVSSCKLFTGPFRLEVRLGGTYVT